MKSLLAFCCLVFPVGNILAQCSEPTGIPASGACPTTGTAVTSALDGTTLAAGTTYYYTSATALTLTNVTIKGTLYVCGNLTINTLNFSGTPDIVVEPGGTLTIYTGTIKGDVTNYGTMSFLDGSNQVGIDGQVANYGTMTFGDNGANIGTGINGNSGYLIYNGVDATLTVEGTSINSAAITNFGQIYFNADLNQQNASICEGNGAEITVEDFNDDETPGISLDAPGDVVGLVVTKILGGSSSNGTLANSANVYICEAPGITIGTPYLVGSATVETNCTSLSGTLSIILQSFTATAGFNNTCTLDWTTASEDGLFDFIVESSTDARTFTPVATIPAHGQASAYSWSTGLKGGTTWFRLQLNGTQGNAVAYSSILPVQLPNGATATPPLNALQVAPSLVTNNSLQVQTTLSAAQSGTWVVMDMMGRTLLTQRAALNQGANSTVLSLPEMASGIYVLTLEGGSIRLAPARFAVVR